MSANQKSLKQSVESKTCNLTGFKGLDFDIILKKNPQNVYTIHI